MKAKTQERLGIFSLAAIMAGRMLGLFMLFPVFALYIKSIPGATPARIGVALGIYGLTQGLLQIPFGMLSDRIGRKPVIAMGLIVFIIGSLIAALSSSIIGIILGRALQGGGAIGSTVLAMAADLTRDEKRTEAMAIIGMTIGFSFALALILGPMINAWFHLSGIFWATLLGALGSLILLYTVVPPPPMPIVDPEVEAKPSTFKAVIQNPTLLRLDFGIFTLHGLLTASFIAIPILLSQTMALSTQDQALYYLVVLVVSFLIALPLIIWSEKKQKIKQCLIGAIVILTLCPFAFYWMTPTLIKAGVILLLFFSAFTLLEATLPSWISKIAPIRQKGSAMGVYSSSQFLGIFFGGSMGGWIFGHFHSPGLFIFCIIMGLCWLLFAITLPHPPYFSTVTLSFANHDNLEAVSQTIHKMEGIVDVVIVPLEHTIHVKINKKIITEDELRNRIKQSTLDSEKE